MNRYRVMLQINGQVNMPQSTAPRTSWRYAVCRLEMNTATGKLVAGEIVEGGFFSRQAAVEAKRRWEDEQA